MKHNPFLYTTLLFVVILTILIGNSNINAQRAVPSYDPGITQHWIKIGTGAAVLRMQPTKVIHIKLTPTSAAGTLDISGLGLTTILDKQISAQRNASDVQVAFKSVSTSTINYNLTQGNSATVVILGISVLSGAPLISATDLTNVEINITITGY